eukprot:7122590-Pyramimonas_sp.AAC.1
MSAHPSHGSWPPRELHRRPQRERPHGTAAPFWRTPQTARGPRGSSTECPSGGVRMAPLPHFGTPLTRVVVS